MNPQPCIPSLLEPVMSPVSKPASLTDQLAAYFRVHPKQWIDGKHLALIAGGYAWRSRCADLRKPPFTMRIDNRQQRLKTADGQRYTVSEYRYVP